MPTTFSADLSATNEAAHLQGLLLRGAEVAKELGISRALAYRWMLTGVLPVVRVPGSKTVRVPRDVLLQWIKERTQGGLSA
jgi:excisionase family DNA binding protein